MRTGASFFFDLEATGSAYANGARWERLLLD